MRDERPIETLARRIVADVLGVPVEQHDDNSLPSMVDAKIQSRSRWSWTSRRA